MRFIPTRLHGWIDYIVSVFMILAPAIFGFNDDRDASLIFVVLGIAGITYSVFTDYELGFAGMIPMKVHLMLDKAAGLVLAASPWLLGFADRVVVPHVVIGALSIIIAFCTVTQPIKKAEHKIYVPGSKADRKDYSRRAHGLRNRSLSDVMK